MFEGIDARMEKEIKALAPQSMKIKIVAPVSTPLAPRLVCVHPHPSPASADYHGHEWTLVRVNRPIAVAALRQFLSHPTFDELNPAGFLLTLFAPVVVVYPSAGAKVLCLD